MSLSKWKRCLCPLGTHLFHVGYYVLVVGTLKSVDEAIQV